MSYIKFENTIDKKYLALLTILLVENNIKEFSITPHATNSTFIISAVCDPDFLDELCNEAHGGFYDYILADDVIKKSKELDIDLGDEAIDSAEQVIQMFNQNFIENNKNTTIEIALDRWEYENSFTRDLNDLT
jgi:hypothetical protein